jgi:hypothetical protein
MSINKEIRSITSGNRTTVSQAFYNNNYADSDIGVSPIYLFKVPEYITYGGTPNYYDQDATSIFTNVGNPPLRFIFTANTFSLSGNSYFVHELYKLSYDIHRLYSDNQITNKPSFTNKNDTDNITDSTTGIKNKAIQNEETLKLGNNPIPIPEKFFGQALTEKDLATIQTYFENPISVITASTTGITGAVYDIPIDQFVTTVGSYKQEALTDKAQYFLKTKLIFTIDLNKNYSEQYQVSGNTIVSNEWNNFITAQTVSETHIITGETYSGLNVAGHFFTYFIVPDQPIMEYPITQGNITTFTPEFRWSNSDKADSCVVQICYDIFNTGFTGSSIVNYPIEKTADNVQVLQNVTYSVDSQASTTKNVYTTQIPIQSNTEFIYRIGNSKEIIDVFDVRRAVVAYSAPYTAQTLSTSLSGSVLVEIDSKNNSDPVIPFVPPSLDYENTFTTYSLYGTISGSTISGGTANLITPNGSTLTAFVQTGGTYSYSGLIPGDYSIYVNYRGYLTETFNFNISGTTTYNFRIANLWSNSYDTFGAFANEIPVPY